MMDPNLQPLPEDVQRLLDSTPRPTVPPGFESRLLFRVTATLSQPPPVTMSAPAAPKMGRWGIPMSAVALSVGMATGLIVGRSTAPAPSAPVVVQLAPRAVSVAAEPTRESAPQDAPATPVVTAPALRKQEPPVVKPPNETQRQASPPRPERDVALADERALIEVARTALAKREMTKALETLEAHAQRFPAGQLSEERESLWVQALVIDGRPAEARKKAEEFQRQYPDSMLQPAVDAALNSAR